MTPLRSVLYITLGVVLIVALVVGGYRLGWWLKKDTVDRNVGIENRNTGTQTAWHDRATDLMNQAALLPPGANREAIERQACELIGRLTDPYRSDDLVAFQTQECQ